MSWFEQHAGLEGTVAVVTGGAGGLGGAITRALAANGVQVAVLDIDAAACEEVAAELGDLGLVRHGDVRDPDQLGALFDALDAQWGRVDTLVNVPGGTFQADFTDTKPKGWDTLLRMNLMHVLHACSLAVPRMQAGGRGGSIVNITTIECHRAAPGFAVYSAAKAGVEQFGRTLAVELGPDNIRVNNVAPDYTPTPNMLRLAADRPPKTALDLSVGIPMARGGEVVDVAGCVVFLASNLSSYVTGSTLHPDGGTYASSGWFNWPGIGWRNNVPAEVAKLMSEADGSAGT
jgi:NAD(P)-dependent dehydrogenase (short-subunit alcohol dehydrogenase family)